jgi:hypothetical protein
VGDHVELGRRQIAGRLRMDLAAGVQPQPDAPAIQRGLQRSGPFRDLITVASVTPAATIRTACATAVDSSGAPSSTPGRRWRCRSARVTLTFSVLAARFVLRSCYRIRP